MTKKRKYSDSFNEIFIFFLKSYRSGLLTFCGQKVDIISDINGADSKQVFFNYENGRYKIQDIVTKHPNMVKGVLVGKKGWGLFLNLWSEGISEGSFTLDEILLEFDSRNIPKPLLNDFINRINSKIYKII